MSAVTRGGPAGATSLDQARDFFASLGEGASMMIKALAGGGGRGMRAVSRVEEIDEAYKRCQSEARASFGIGDVYVEQLMPRARHIEVQIIGDGSGNVSHLWERECSIQRRNQKIVEIAPSPGLERAIRDEWGREPMRVREGGVCPPFVLSSAPGPSDILSLSSHSPYHAWLSSKKPSVALCSTSR